MLEIGLLGLEVYLVHRQVKEIACFAHRCPLLHLRYVQVSLGRLFIKNECSFLLTLLKNVGFELLFLQSLGFSLTALAVSLKTSRGLLSDHEQLPQENERHLYQIAEGQYVSESCLLSQIVLCHSAVLHSVRELKRELEGCLSYE